MKISAQELRIGNFVKLNGPGEPMDVCVLGVEQDVVYYNRFLEVEKKTEFFRAVYYCIIGIPLTEEWLVEFGFSEDSEGIFDICVAKPHFKFHQGVYIIRVVKNDNGWWMILDEYKGPGRGGINLGTFHFIHQLQNIYQSLTLKELGIKEEIICIPPRLHEADEQGHVISTNKNIERIKLSKEDK